MKTQAQKDSVNELGRVFGELSAENNSASEVQGGEVGGYLYPLNICRLYQQSLSSTKCHRTAAQLYSRVIPREGVAADAVFSGKGLQPPPPEEEGGVSFVKSAEVRGGALLGPPLTFCTPCLCGQEGV